ncbi:ATP-binding protein [Ruficoccus amylovorans]|uniref:ATP-binding protein n=1 Tax=Ruficoccus amylovorans TaxID=1804625 RepID=A0A842HE62_9BACT|nr:ATP-binding protein [Ruficoccus amylovorans]MBC2594510.1 ATP-binding protein [Ruficoccus amylovorans]
MDFTYINDVKELNQLAADLERFGEAHDLNPALVHTFNLCLDEVLTNIISYAYEVPAQHHIYLSMKLIGDEVEAVIRDHGKAFDPLHDAREPDIDAPLEERPIGGLGIFFCKQLMDHIEYRRIDETNTFTMRKANISALPEED